MEEIQHTGIGPVLGETSCRYKLPVTYPDTLYVGSRVSELKEDRFTMEYEIVSKKLGAVTTSGTAKVVMFNFKTNNKTILSPSLVEAIESIESRVSVEQVTVD